jgi:PPOX class probable F420-dependent enzyme
MPRLDDHVEQRLRSDWWIWLITVRPDGRPHVVLVGFFWDGKTFLIFSQPNTQKVRNVRYNPQVTLALDGTGKLGHDVVVVEGTAELLTATTLRVLQAEPAIAEKYEYSDQDLQAKLADYTQPIRVTPSRFLLGAAMQSISI